MFQKSTKGVCTIRSMIFLKIKGFNTQNTLLSMVQKMLLARGKKEVCKAILTDLSKAFDCISHDLLIAKLNAYGFMLFIIIFLEDLRKLNWVLLLVIC